MAVISRCLASVIGDAGGVAGDPAPAPLLRDVRRRPRAARRIEHEIAGVGGHQEATLDDLRVRLDNVDAWLSELRCRRVIPNVRLSGYAGKVI